MIGIGFFELVIVLGILAVMAASVVAVVILVASRNK
jgi:hypothetical protein